MHYLGFCTFIYNVYNDNCLYDETDWYFVVHGGKIIRYTVYGYVGVVRFSLVAIKRIRLITWI